MDETMAEARRREAGRIPIFFLLRVRSSSPKRRQPLQPTTCTYLMLEYEGSLKIF
ncbi:hypothetical protein C1H46_022760 [Malus baccata]|uniref:Uncharacterized protein n=1 Tax=Malus baccata TaxID=106549 RepID=A0A540LZ65_MALBA|nr:hypothetical protein C1H46_022760 [Malus baccata]